MSRTYIEPFGRYLPILDDNEPYKTEQGEISSENHSNMTTYQLPPPIMPTRLQFGTDLSPGSTEPTKYNTMTHSRTAYDAQKPNYEEHPRRTYHEQLPSVSQLLTPGSQSSAPNSPFLPQHSPEGSEMRHAYPSSHRNSFPERSSPIPVAYATHGGYAQMPFQALQGEVMDLRNHGFQHGAQAPHYSSSYNARQETNAVHYPTYATSSQQHYAHHLPLNISPHAPAQFHPAQPPNFALSSASSAGFDQTRHDTALSIKPLARVIGEQEIVGEGLCWVYEDGSICKKVIDGEEVNANWGVTKAGKPRKRLGIACTTCREKKIKCDPGMPKCMQCDKFGRECRFTTAFRSQLSRPESPSYDLQARISSSMIAPKGPPLHCGQITPNGSVERDRILAFKRRNSLHNPISVKHDIGNEPRSIRGPTMLKKRRHAPSSIKFENDFEELSPKTEEKTAQGLEYHSWKLSAVEVECRHCSERKLLPCSYLKLSPSLVQSGILPRIPRLEGESPCCAKQAKHSNSEDWPISQTAVCA